MKISSLIIIAAILSSCKTLPVVTKNTDGQVIERYRKLKKSDQKHGMYRLYHENGRLAMEIYYTTGKLHGEEKSYYENGQLESISKTEMGSYEGPFKYWYATGVLKQEGNYVNNQIEGELKTYYPNAVLKENVTFSGSVENGYYIMYHQNGKIKEEGYFLNGPIPDGIIKQYDGEGILIRKLFCEKGTCTTTWESVGENKNQD